MMMSPICVDLILERSAYGSINRIEDIVDNNIIDLENRTENIVNKILRAWKTRNYIRKIYQKKIFPLRNRVQRVFNILVN